MTATTQQTLVERLAAQAEKEIARLAEPAPAQTDNFVTCDNMTLLAQIGQMNLMAISGRRVTARQTGVTLPVSSGYSVTVDLAAGDTYTVRRVFKRGSRVWVKGERTNVYCEEVGEVAYEASCYKNVDF